MRERKSKVKKTSDYSVVYIGIAQKTLGWIHLHITRCSIKNFGRDPEASRPYRLLRNVYLVGTNLCPMLERKTSFTHTTTTMGRHAMRIISAFHLSHKSNIDNEINNVMSQLSKGDRKKKIPSHANSDPGSRTILPPPQFVLKPSSTQSFFLLLFEQIWSI